MRGHVLLRRFAEDRELDWTRVDPDLERDVSDARNDERLRTVLWTGLRALATIDPELSPNGPHTMALALPPRPEPVDMIASTLAERDEECVEDLQPRCTAAPALTY